MMYYELDRIEKDEDFPANCWGFIGNKKIEVFYFSADDTEDELEKKGFVKCDAPNWNETMVTEQSNFN